MDWIEVRLRRDAKPGDLYDWLRDRDEIPGHVHHFWDEPWWPRGYVVRLRDTEADVGECPAVDHVIPWDASEDEALYGDYWDWAQRFFEAGSMFACADNPAAVTKLVHCHLNAHGMDPSDEGWWALKFAWNRLTISLRWRLYLKRRWLRANPEMKGIVT